MIGRGIYSHLQYPGFIPGGPNVYIVIGPLSIKYAEFGWLISDFCRMHQIVHDGIHEAEQNLEKSVDEFKKNLKQFKETPQTEDDEDYGQICFARIRENIRSQDMENKRVRGFADQMAVVGLWAIAEQYLGTLYREYIACRDEVEASSINSPYRWNEFKGVYSDLGIELSDCDDFRDANECRELNNAIKHNPVVGEKLVNFPYFLSYEGEKLMNSPLEVQRYLNGVSNFLGSLTENLDSRLTGENW